jgi:ATP-binding cassette subfamily C protein
VEQWIEEISAALTRNCRPTQLPFELKAGKDILLQAQQEGRPTEGVVWVTWSEGLVGFAGQAAEPHPAVPLPLTPRTWIRADSPAQLSCQSTAALHAMGKLEVALDGFQRLALQALGQRHQQDLEAQRERLSRRAEAEARAEQGMERRLAAILTSGPPESPPEFLDPLLAACWHVGRATGISIRAPDYQSEDGFSDPVQRIAQASNVRARPVRLEGAWWLSTDDSLVGFTREGQPVALIREHLGKFTLCNPTTAERIPLTPAVANTLGPTAVIFYRSFPEGPVSALRLFRWGLSGTLRDGAWIMWLSLAAGLLGLLPPYFTGLLFSQIIPAANRYWLAQVAACLTVAAMVNAIFMMVRGLALTRFGARFETSTEAGIWDRLLALPPSFFRTYTAGDLAMRAFSIRRIRAVWSAAVITTLLAGMSGLFNLFLLFYYSPQLAQWTLLLLLPPVLATLLVGWVQLVYSRRATEASGKMQGWVLQLITGIAKIRIAGAERRLFACWSQRFADAKGPEHKAHLLLAGLTTFNAAYDVLSLLAIYGLAVLWRPAEVPIPPVGDLIGFTAAFVGLTTVVLGATVALIQCLETVPLFAFARPLLQTAPEVVAEQRDPKKLSGALQVKHVFFGYNPDLPPVLQDVSIDVRPGEFIALVGPSGSGKSTLLRLLLGFEIPHSGSIYYDQTELVQLDVRAVRRQIGTVLQNATVMAGSLFENIVGSYPLTLDDAWEAARKSGLAEDIQRMPMGMQTMVSQGGGTLSGGQRQRLLIARALARKPRILLFDEATSALDNRTQETVRRSLEELRVTRLVIAHRLSTVMRADRIVVLESGRVVQAGTFAELMGQPGLFAEMARRQQLGGLEAAVPLPVKLDSE